MTPEFAGIERRLDELNERLSRLRPLQEKSRAEFLADPYLRDIVERNLEVAAQCCIDIGHRIISVQDAQKPRDYYESIFRLGEMEILPADFARHLAPIAGFRNILIHDYLTVNWDIVYQRLHQLDDLEQFARYIRIWLREYSDEFTGPPH